MPSHSLGASWKVRALPVLPWHLPNMWLHTTPWLHPTIRRHLLCLRMWKAGSYQRALYANITHPPFDTLLSPFFSFVLLYSRFTSYLCQILSWWAERHERKMCFRWTQATHLRAGIELGDVKSQNLQYNVDKYPLQLPLPFLSFFLIPFPIIISV